MGVHENAWSFEGETFQKQVEYRHNVVVGVFGIGKSSVIFKCVFKVCILFAHCLHRRQRNCGQLIQMRLIMWVYCHLRQIWKMFFIFQYCGSRIAIILPAFMQAKNYILARRIFVKKQRAVIIKNYILVRRIFVKTAESCYKKKLHISQTDFRENSRELL